MNPKLSFIVACLRFDKQGGSYWKLNLRTSPLFLDILQSIGHLRREPTAPCSMQVNFAAASNCCIFNDAQSMLQRNERTPYI